MLPEVLTVSAAPPLGRDGVWEEALRQDPSCRVLRAGGPHDRGARAAADLLAKVGDQKTRCVARAFKKTARDLAVW